MKRKQEKKLADYLDREKQRDEHMDKAPADEFEQIMAEMSRREIIPQIRRKLKRK